MAAKPTSKRMGLEKTAKQIYWPAARSDLPRATPATAVASVFLGKSEMGREPGAVSPKHNPKALEVPRSAQERPSCGGNQSTSLVLAGGVGK